MNIAWCKSRTILLFIFCLGLTASCATSVQRSLEAVKESPALAGAYSGIVVKSLTDGTYQFRTNDEKFFVPASNMKLFTTAAALVMLGPEFSYRTGLYTDGEIRDGVLTGNLIIRGVGDPTLSDRFHPGGVDDIFSSWAETLVRLGVVEVKGDILGDGSLFGEPSMGRGWAWDDDLYCYSAEISALSINDNCVAISIRPGAVGQTPSVSVNDSSGYIAVQSQATTTAADQASNLRLSRAPGTNLLTLSGSIPANAGEERIFVTVHNPALFTAAHLRHLLESKGIRVSGIISDRRPLSGGFSYESMRLIDTYSSPPLREVITDINKASRNLSSELLFRTMGESSSGDGSAKAAAEVLQRTLTTMSVPPGSILIYDGSGLSRMNLVTPTALLALLEYMYRHELRSYFLSSLPVAGIDGTLRERLRNTQAQGKVMAKTGAMTHVLNLSGYMKGREGGMYAFSILMNNFSGPSTPVKTLQDSLLIHLIGLLD